MHNNIVLWYDSEWMIVDANGIAINLKRVPKMCMIVPKIDMKLRTLTLTAPDCDDFVLSLDEKPEAPKNFEGQKLKVCGSEVRLRNFFSSE